LEDGLSPDKAIVNHYNFKRSQANNSPVYGLLFFVTQFKEFHRINDLAAVII
jgi:hypothetical protein